jgi:isoleucyl-tRNA synthetase
MLKFPELEEKVLAFWKEHKIFEKSLTKPHPAGRFVFFEGPPTANGKPGLHHVLARAFKDLIPRYKTMRGFQVERKAGWDTQGLPVELQVEKELKFRGKPDIEKYGVAKFNERCREDVWKYKADWEKLTERIGFWLDLENPYVTYENYYIESLWWILKQVHEAGLLYKDYKVLPHCPRCGTALSSHEVALGYKSVTEPSVFVKFKVKEPKEHGLPKNTYILSWTTTPWTLPGNVALAINPKSTYVLLEVLKKSEVLSINNQEPLVDEIPAEFYILAKDRVEEVQKRIGGIVEKEFLRDQLVGLEYEPLFDIKSLQNDKSYRVYAADFVTTTDGTGVVHTAVMYGEDDFNLGTEVGLPKYHTVNEEGKFTKDVPEFAGMPVKHKDKPTEEKTTNAIIDNLKNRSEGSLIFKEEMYTHDYPFCWRCSTPLLYYAKPSWFIKMSALREDLKKANEKINWYPEHIKHGRFGEWLDGVKDWAISRERYWGTPLPIWVCDKCKEIMCVGNLEELAKLAPNHESRIMNQDFDIHRPFIDEISWPCKCGGTTQRVPEVADCWFDSGSMPFAQWGYPHKPGSKEQLANSYPADYISEAIDQTRGWFYTLLAIATLLKKAGAIKEIPPYKNVICLGHINDKNGQKMSKSKGNIVDPWEVIAKYGVDALRFHLYTGNQPGEPKNFDPQAVDEVVKRTLLILMNVLAFYELYKGDTKVLVSEPKSDNILDKWILSLWQKTIFEVTEHFDKYEITEAGRKLADFITDLSTWYVRRSRDRFKEEGADKEVARDTLGYLLRQLALALAPFMPFVAEELYQRVGGDKESVHLEDWPKVKEISSKQNELLEQMEKARSEVEKALAQRAATGFKVRQVLGSLTTAVKFDEDISAIIAEEVNVQKVIFGTETKLDISMNDELKALGLVREFIRQVNVLRKEKKMTIHDRILLTIGCRENFVKIVEDNKEIIIKGTLASDVIVINDDFDDKLEIESFSISVSIKK